MPEVPRRSAVTATALFEDHVVPRVPVVLTDCFAGQEIAEVDTADAAVAAWGGVVVELQDEYARAEREPSPPTTATVAEYLEQSRRRPGSIRCCTEYPTPARVLASVRLPDVCRMERDPAPEILDLPRKYGEHDLVTNLFLANAGNVAHLHFDGDQREVLLHQVFGRKRVLLLPPSAAPALRPLDGPRDRPSLAGLPLESMPLEEQLALVDRCGGWHTVLEPGETLYVPLLFWHHVEYLDDALSFNLRFARTRFGRFLSLDNFHRDPLLQNLAATFGGPAASLDQHCEAVEELVDVFVAPARDLARKVAAVRATTRALCRLHAPVDPDAVSPPEREAEQVSRIVASRDLQGGMKYADPAAIRRSRPRGPATDRQREVVARAIADRGWPDAVVPRVLDSLVGKAGVDALDKAEAAVVLEYLRSPGATW